ncbi:uncharacterized protein CLUP02_15407 [Colletotrichum lupini]|uniref:Uncharacterized protein n=1 Tax=Colletotrichum lupini TaxID=145971 RepID=A0A9Q8T889_9PEZI|nr:uncharacterized protein CLUP02_15407 [Colletotrichum lupini]UQC89876.1 hypothetical protein CLUP02_15407 [Colletotrichum lupini]
MRARDDDHGPNSPEFGRVFERERERERENSGKFASGIRAMVMLARSKRVVYEAKASWPSLDAGEVGCGLSVANFVDTDVGGRPQSWDFGATALNATSNDTDEVLWRLISALLVRTPRVHQSEVFGEFVAEGLGLSLFSKYTVAHPSRPQFWVLSPGMKIGSNLPVYCSDTGPFGTNLPRPLYADVTTNLNEAHPMYSLVGTPASGPVSSGRIIPSDFATGIGASVRTSASRLRCSQWGGGAPSGDLHHDTAGKQDRSLIRRRPFSAASPASAVVLASVSVIQQPQGRCMDPVIEPFMSETVTDTVTATATKSLKQPIAAATPMARYFIAVQVQTAPGTREILRLVASRLRMNLAHMTLALIAGPWQVEDIPRVNVAPLSCIGPTHSGTLLPVRFEQYCNGSKKSRWRTIPDKATALVICLTRVNGGQPERRYLQDSRTASGVTISAQLHQVGLKFATQVAACLEHRQLQSSQEPPPRLLDTQERDGLVWSPWALVMFHPALSLVYGLGASRLASPPGGFDCRLESDPSSSPIAVSASSQTAVQCLCMPRQLTKMNSGIGGQDVSAFSGNAKSATSARCSRIRNRVVQTLQDIARGSFSIRDEALLPEQGIPRKVFSQLTS